MAICRRARALAVVLSLEGELSKGEIVSFLGTREGAALVRAFTAIKPKAIRQNAIAFLETLKGK
jgi:hypothetical protein